MKHALFLLRSNEISVFQKLYFFLRLLMLPISEIDAMLPKKGIILDLGCGIGALSFFLAISSNQRLVFGWDIDTRRISAAKKITKDVQNLRFEEVSALEIGKKKNLDGVVISDVLHHIEFSQQEEVVKKIFSSLNKDGVLVIKEVDNSQKIRALLSLFWDRLFYPHEISYFRTKNAWITLLKRNHFSIEVKRTMLWFPGSQTLFICKKTSS